MVEGRMEVRMVEGGSNVRMVEGSSEVRADRVGNNNPFSVLWLQWHISFFPDLTVISTPSSSSFLKTIGISYFLLLLPLHHCNDLNRKSALMISKWKIRKKHTFRRIQHQNQIRMSRQRQRFHHRHFFSLHPFSLNQPPELEKQQGTRPARTHEVSAVKRAKLMQAHRGRNK